MLIKIIYLVLILLLLLVVVFVVFYTVSGKKAWFFKLNKSYDGKLDQVAGLVHIGDEGVCISGLRPMGKAIFKGNEFEVTSNGEYIDEKTSIKVIGVLKNKITVTKIK